MSLLRIGLFVLLCTPAALRGQEMIPAGGFPVDSVLAAPPLPVVDIQQRTASQRFARMVIPASLGSGLGLLAGGYVGSVTFYNATGCCGGGDDPGLESGLMGAAIGATLGSMIGAYATRSHDHPVSLARAFLGATVGLGTGIAMGFAGGSVGDVPGLLIGFSVGQGVTTSLFAVPYP